MKNLTLSLTLFPLLAGGTLLAQQSTPQQLTPRADAQDAFDAGAWASRLRGPDLRERMGTFDALVRAAGRDEAVLGQLRAWADDESDLELAWSAQLALRELERAPAAAPSRTPRWRGDVFTDPFRGFGGGGSIDQLFDELRREMESLRRGLPTGPRWQGLPPGAFGSSQGFRMEQTPDGVKIEITERVGGNDQTRTYEGATLEELLEANPELREHVQTGPGGGLQRSPWSRLAPRDPFGRAEDDEPDDLFSRPAIPNPLAPLPATPRTDRLGVQVREPSGVGEVGLAVVEVLPGSLGAALGVRPGDVLTELNGAELHGVADVKRALSERADDEPVVLEVVGPDGRASTLTWRPRPAAEAVGPGRKV